MKVIYEKAAPPAPRVQREVPMLFSAPMVLALLADRKTQTRRTLSARNSLVDGQTGKAAVPFGELDLSKARVDSGPSPAGNPGPYLKAPRKGHGTVRRIYPRVQPGDRIWVKETWAECEAPLLKGKPQYAADGAILQRVQTNGGESWWERHGHTTGISDASLLGRWVGKPSKWRPSIFMPRWASRITLDVLAIRPERLLDLSDADALAEGCQSNKDQPGPRGYRFSDDFPLDSRPRDAFRRGWNDLHSGKRSHLWFTDARDDVWSPFVWVFTFKRIESGKAAA